MSVIFNSRKERDKLKENFGRQSFPGGKKWIWEGMRNNSSITLIYNIYIEFETVFL